MAQIDFPPSPALDFQFTAQNGIVYVCVNTSPVVWQVVEQSSNTGQRLWNRDGVDNYIYPIFAGDDIYVRDNLGNPTTIITAGAGSDVPSLKVDNLLFAHMPPLPS